ncbi:MAG: beta-lactamase family protein [Oscillospiraceae bacterium]|jgi:CubicO group peptidase (beta-lactamase class C family)|nr:beta-lactamase family protein [Oscillospiraceae bacterium]
MNFDKLTAYLDSIYAEKNIPGVGMTIAVDNNPVYEHYYGWSNVEEKVPFSPETIFNLYSATKLVTCTCALQLIERGKIRLTDPLYEYIPEYKHQNVKVKTDGGEVVREAGTIITLEHLFTMTSGISGRRDAPAILKVVEDTQGRAPTVDIVRAAAAEPLNFEPGSHFQYGYSHDVLGAVVEIVSGQRLGAYMKEHVFDPLGMGSTAFELIEGKERYRTVLYNNFNAETGKAESIGQAFKLRFGSEYEMGGGGLLSCVPDYSRFARALANGGAGESGERILNPETIDDWRTNRLSGEPLEDFAVFGGWSKAGYGYGLGVRTLMDRERNNSLSETGEFGWDGAQGCYVVVDPKARVAIFYAQQEGGSQWWTWHGTLRNLAYASTWS